MCYLLHFHRSSGCTNAAQGYVIRTLAVLFQLSGIGVLGVGVWTVVAKHQYVVLLTNATYEVAAWVLIAAGCLVVVVTAVGCIGVLQDNRFFILMVRLPDLAFCNVTRAIVLYGCETWSLTLREERRLRAVAYPGIFFGGGGVQQIQLRTEDREDGDLGAVAP